MDTPAFIDAVITLDDADQSAPESEADADEDGADEPVAASGGAHALADSCACGGTCGGCAPAAALAQVRAVAAAATTPEGPPAEWFEDPQLAEPTPITVTGDGRVFGHIARHDTCHVGLAGCTTAPASLNGYATFHRYAETASGIRLPVAAGRITGGHGRFADACSCCPGSDDHACINMSFAEAVAQHDQMPALAYVRVGEDVANNAIWAAGMVAPEANDLDRALLSRRLVSGDWRPFGSGVELTEVLALHRERPGFPVAMVATGGRVRALVAAGVLVPSPAEPAPAVTAALSPEAARAMGEEAGKAFAAVLDARDAAPLRRQLAAVGAERKREQTAPLRAKLRELAP